MGIAVCCDNPACRKTAAAVMVSGFQGHNDAGRTLPSLHLPDGWRELTVDGRGPGVRRPAVVCSEGCVEALTRVVSGVEVHSRIVRAPRGEG
jgi:hypothetical protein